MLISPQYDRKLWIFDFVTHEVAENHVGNHLCSTFHKCFLSLMSCKSCSQNTAEKCWNYWYCKASLDQERTTTFFLLFFHSFGDFFSFFTWDLVICFVFLTWQKQIRLCYFYQYMSTGKKNFKKSFQVPSNWHLLFFVKNN